MKKIIRIKTLFIAFVLMAMFGCEKNTVGNVDTEAYEGANFKFYNFALSSPTVNGYANNIKFAGILSTTGIENAAGVVGGGVAPARGYALVPQGTNIIFKAVTPSTMPVTAASGFGPNLTVAEVTATVKNGKNYSFYVCGLFNKTTQKADGFVIEDTLPQPDTAASYIRLVNPGHNTSTLSLEITRTQTIDGVVVVDTSIPITGVAYKTASDFVKVPSGAYTLKLIDLVSGKTLTRTATGFGKNRVYTFTLRGDMVSGVVSSPTVFLDFTENR